MNCIQLFALCWKIFRWNKYVFVSGQIAKFQSEKYDWLSFYIKYVPSTKATHNHCRKEIIHQNILTFESTTNAQKILYAQKSGERTKIWTWTQESWDMDALKSGLTHFCTHEERKVLNVRKIIIKNCSQVCINKQHCSMRFTYTYSKGHQKAKKLVVWCLWEAV